MSGGGMLSPARGFGDVLLRGLIDSGAAPGWSGRLGLGERRSRRGWRRWGRSRGRWGV